jgi:SAM-dependent methyltransferase
LKISTPETLTSAASSASGVLEPPDPVRSGNTLVVPQNLFTGRVAEGYDLGSPEMYEPALLTATAAFLSAEARGGRALEFGIGTGRVALALSQLGVPVSGIDISADMIDQLHRKPASAPIETAVGDFATTVVAGEFSLVYVVFNSITNLLEQSEWVQAFRNAARHLGPAGRFVMELEVPDLRRFPPGSVARPFEVGPRHLGFDTLDLASQQGVSHHYYFVEDQVGRFDSPFRYAWPAEVDLMAEMASMKLRDRFADWDRSPFTGDSRKHISVWERR